MVMIEAMRSISLRSLSSRFLQHHFNHGTTVIAEQSWMQRMAYSSSKQLSLVKQLRDQSGAPISDVKKALVEAEWDLEKASQELRKKGLSAASKKASRSATEGLVGIAAQDAQAAIVEINSETDFVARNDMFTTLVANAADSLLKSGLKGCKEEISATELGSVAMPAGGTLQEAVNEVAGSVRENIQLRRGYKIAPSLGVNGFVGTYLHGSTAPHVGRIASVVVLESEEENQADADQRKILEDACHKLAMHVVGGVPRYLDRHHVPEVALKAERALLIEQAAKSGKPQNIIERMVEGRLKKFYEEVCLLEQPFVMDDKKKVQQVVEEVGSRVNMKLKLTHFARVQVGEGIEIEKKNFAEEVASQLH